MTTPELASAVPLADTPRPPLILTPELNAKPDQTTLALLKRRVERDLASVEVYTITDCDYVSPEGPNYLMTIKPYYWEVEPGKWGERSCGTRPVNILRLSRGKRRISKQE